MVETHIDMHRLNEILARITYTLLGERIGCNPKDIACYCIDDIYTEDGNTLRVVLFVSIFNVDKGASNANVEFTVNLNEGTLN